MLLDLHCVPAWQLCVNVWRQTPKGSELWWMSCCFWALCHFNYFILGNNICFFCFQKERNKKNTSQPSFWSPSFKSRGPWITTSIHTHACNPVVMTTHMWAPNKLLCRVLWRPKHTSECTAYTQIHTHEEPTHKETHFRRKHRPSEFSCVPTYFTPTGTIQRSKTILWQNTF